MAVSVPCPNCRKKLKLPSADLLGKVVKCPGCEKRVQLPKAKPAAAKPKSAKPAAAAKTKPASESSPAAETEPPEITAKLVDDPPTGLEPRYVDDDPSSSARVSAETAEFSLADSPSQTIPTFDAAAEAAAEFDAEPPVQKSTDTSGTAADAVKARLAKKRAQRKRKNTIIGVTGAALLAVAGSAVILLKPDPPAEPRPQAEADPAANAADDAAVAAIVSPTNGPRIPTTLLPAGVSVLMHVRPSDLFTDVANQAVRESLPPSLIPFVRTSLEDLAGVPPEEIEEATIGVILGARGVPPEVCGVFRLRADRDLGRWIQSLGGRSETLGGDARMVRGDDRATLILDPRTFGVCPAKYAEDMADAATVESPYLARSIADLVAVTDRSRLFSVLAGTADLDLQGNAMLPPAAVDMARSLLDTFGPDVEAFAWSVDAREDFYSEIALRPRAGVAATTLEDDLRRTLTQMSDEADRSLKRYAAAASSNELVQRYPAMLDAFAKSSDVSPQPGGVVVRTLLPAKAAPNLALATVATFNVLRQDPSAGTVKPAAAKVDSRSLAERLDTPIDAEFDRTPLQEAVQYIAGEAGITIELDGDGLKLAGYTQNMPQTFNLGTVPAREALTKIIGAYEKMRVVGNASANALTITTIDALDGRTPFELSESP